jgi:hypothetical protein
VKETLEVGNKALAARRYELSPNLVQRWVKAYEEGKLGNGFLFLFSLKSNGWKKKTCSSRSYWGKKI